MTHCIPPSSTSSTAIAASVSSMPNAIIEEHILTRLDGPTLASLSCTSTHFHALSCNLSLWTNITHSTWPSTINLPHTISRSRTFFSQCFSHPSNKATTLSKPFNNYYIRHDVNSMSEDPGKVIHTPGLCRYINSCSTRKCCMLMSAVDVYCHDEFLLSKYVVQETFTNWFKHSPYRVDMLKTKEVVLTELSGDTCENMGHGLRLSWILIEPAGQRAVNLSSFEPVCVERHWLTGEVHVRFGTMVGGAPGTAREHVLCEVIVTCGGTIEKKMQVREVYMQLEDLDGVYLNGRDSLDILSSVLEGKMGNVGRRLEGEGVRRYREFLEMKRERKERKLRRERWLDCLSVGFGIVVFGLFLIFISL